MLLASTACKTRQLRRASTIFAQQIGASLKTEAARLRLRVGRRRRLMGAGRGEGVGSCADVGGVGVTFGRRSIWQ